MTIKASDFRTVVLTPAMNALVPAGIPNTLVGSGLVFATIAQESLVGTWLLQSGGPALGIGQIEPASLLDLLNALTPAQSLAVKNASTPDPIATQLGYNLKLATMLVRLFYYHKPFPLAPTLSVNWLWTIYKTYYNTNLGAAQMGAFVDNLALTDLGLSS